MHEIRSTLKKLYEYAGDKISSLPKDLSLDFKSIVAQAEMLRNSDYYTQLWDICQEVFTHHNKELEPFTVACYFLGCMTKSPDGMEEGCTLLCAGAMSPPSCEDEFSYCSKNTYWLKKTRNGNVLQIMGECQGSSQAYIYVNYNCLESFPGFQKRDIAILTDFGITEVHLYGYYNNRYYELTGGFISIKVLPICDKDSSSERNRGFWLALCVLVIIIIFLIIWYIWRNGLDKSDVEYLSYDPKPSHAEMRSVR
uniref:Transmembrane protein n=1 Tax=Pithovirus LCPAC403 TaxID=2506596 RepID=A0A481ZAU2_9VIRU|nr:MAG: uncharacterized protein LCPAC403_01770 [Pithovirus LCPAC403]